MGRITGIGRKYKDDPEILAVSVCMDRDPEDREDWGRTFGKGWVTLHDGCGKEKLSKAYGISMTPTYCVVDGKGRVRFCGIALDLAEKLLVDLRIKRFLDSKRAGRR